MVFCSRPFVRGIGPLVLAALAPLAGVCGDESAKKVDYNRDVRPILAENCYRCHGPDAGKREAGLRLDDRTAAFAALKSGHRALVAGDPDSSALISRVSSTDPSERMPPADIAPALSEAQIRTLRAWIEEGAEWAKHWAYVVPDQPKVPDPERAEWTRNAIDRFILARLEREKLAPSPAADRRTLLRRLSFDLTGLPPTREELDAFLLDASADAYEKAVERLLASPHYGERMAVFWLDLVRFADTRGYHSDNPRNVTPYRDYVIRSFNENQPFDEFTIEQLAGDLLPEPTVWQRVASCYNKLNQTTEEGGAQPKEYEAKNQSDRVRNISAVWMGATVGCAECHDHKFDPYTARDFYSLGAFFADIREAPIMDRDAGIPVPSPDDEVQLARLTAKLDELRSRIDDPPDDLRREIERDQRAWESQVLAEQPPPRLGVWHSVGPFAAENASAAFRTAFPPEESGAAGGPGARVDLGASFGEGDARRWRKREEWVDGKAHELSGQNSATYLYRTIESDAPRSVDLSFGSDDGIRVWLNGSEILSKEILRGVAPDQDKVAAPLKEGVNDLLVKVNNGSGGHGFYFRVVEGGGSVPDDVRAALEVAVDERNDAQRAVIAKHYRSIAPHLEDARKERTSVEAEKKKLEGSMARCVVSAPAEPRIVRVLFRGDWMDTTGDVVAPAIPAFLGQLDTGDRRATRLDLARWLVASDHPLTARVFVNRLWKLFFGAGLSSRLDDLGAMGLPPTHPELLDWLAVEFVESGWNVKHMIRLMLLSSTYRQSSIATATAAERDPYNQLLARQSRWRIDAEFVRDTALAHSGLLARRIGGRSVKPHQPVGYWAHLNFPKRQWKADDGESRYRRGLYTWWQRSFLHPSLMAFDAPNREECTAERPRSNIPQQALVLLNDPSYVEAAVAFARRILDEGGASTDARIEWAFVETTSRRPDANELAILQTVYASEQRAYAADAEAAGRLVGAKGEESVELAAWTAVARVLFNLHETITRN